MKGNRNEPCPCGSGKKYKICCSVKREPSHKAAIVAVVAFSAIALWALFSVFRGAGDVELPQATEKVWSEEHGHYHEVPKDGQGQAQPSGAAPPGKVWSEEHGHWHDAASDMSLPPGPAPAGKVWSAEHGHWHDADGTETQPSESAPAP